MKTKTVHRTSIFPTDIDDAFEKLQRLDTLQYVAAPYATFTATDESQELTWTVGATYSFRFRLFIEILLLLFITILIIRIIYRKCKKIFDVKLKVYVYFVNIVYGC